MHHVIGFSDKNQVFVWPLDASGRIIFNTDNAHSNGYFECLSPSFNAFSRRDSGTDMNNINVMFVLRDEDFSTALNSLTELEQDLAGRPCSWTVLLGTVHPPRNAPVIRIEPRIFKHRTLALIRVLKAALEFAAEHDKLLVYGNGVGYRHLCGINLPAGTMEYS